MSRSKTPNGKGRSSDSNDIDRAAPSAKAVDPDSGLDRALRRLSKNLPEGYSACILKTGIVGIVCTDHQLGELQKGSKARVYVRREHGQLKATKVTPLDEGARANGHSQPPKARPPKVKTTNDSHAEMTPISRKKKRSKGLTF
jgi:hypothetical protein